MMATLNSLTTQLAALRKRFIAPSRTFLCIVEQGDPVPEDIMAQARPGDTIIAHEMPRGYLGEPEPGEPVGTQVILLGRPTIRRQYGVNGSRV